MTDRDAAETRDTTIHVAQLLQEPVGATRRRMLALADLPLDDDYVARDLEAEVRLTRIPAGILATGQIDATVTLECIRCLELYEQPVETTFSDEYRPTIDIVTGLDVESDDEHEAGVDYFVITSTHVLDLRESLRQAILLALPMAPHCREDCPGLTGELDATGEAADDRLAVLSQLLQADTDETDEAAGADGEQGGDTRRRATR